jgi:hypothetical protein
MYGHGNIAMARAGRKRNKLLLVREPNGRKSRALDEEQFAPAQVKRLRDEALSGMADPEWGTELGRLFLDGTISAPMYGAGKWWAERASEYLAAIGAPPPDAKAVTLERRSPSEPPDPDSPAGLRAVAEDQEALAAMQEAHACLISAGALAEKAVRSLCERNEAPAGEYEKTSAIRGLLWLAEYRRLTKGQN